MTPCEYQSKCKFYPTHCFGIKGCHAHKSHHARQEVLRARARRNYHTHKEAHLSRAREYKRAHRKEMNEYLVEWHKKHPGRRKIYRKRGREKTRIASRLYRQAHPEQVKKWRADWYQTPKGKIYRKLSNIISKAKRRTRLAMVGGSFTKREWEELVNKTHGACLCCSKYFGLEKLTVDHIRPISKGGNNNISNLQPLCLHCNVMKGTKIINFMEE